ALAERAGPWLERLRQGFARDAVNYLLFLRLVPAFPFWLVNIAPALLGMDLPRYVAATFVGIIPGTFAFAFLGAGLDGLIAGQHQAYEDCLERAASAGAGENIECNFSLDPASLLTTELIAAFVALGLVALIPVIYRRMRSR
ncbi:MAG: VTT domain-containing protein, partial [Rhizobiales bacterium]|nr:VTT domain-containing protein [Hyphomicrobiales bacterium]